MKKLLASAALALAMLIGVVATDSTPAHAADICEGVCIDVYDPCADPNAHNWKLCGESSGDSDVVDAHQDRESNIGGKYTDGRHNWKNPVLGN